MLLDKASLIKLLAPSGIINVDVPSSLVLKYAGFTSLLF